MDNATGCASRKHCARCRSSVAFRKHMGAPEVCPMDLSEPAPEPPDPVDKCKACTNFDCEIKPLGDCARRKRLRTGFACQLK
jgi:hypothetical protein